MIDILLGVVVFGVVLVFAGIAVEFYRIIPEIWATQPLSLRLVWMGIVIMLLAMGAVAMFMPGPRRLVPPFPRRPGPGSDEVIGHDER